MPRSRRFDWRYYLADPVVLVAVVMVVPFSVAALAVWSLTGEWMW